MSFCDKLCHIKLSVFLLPEKDELMLRNAQLFQEFEAYKRQTQEDKSHNDDEIAQRDNAIAGLEQSIQDGMEDMARYKAQVGLRDRSWFLTKAIKFMAKECVITF